MNNLRDSSKFNLEGVLNRKFRITPNWVLGFVEAEGSFFAIKRNYDLVFSIKQADDLALMNEIKKFFESLVSETNKVSNVAIIVYQSNEGYKDAYNLTINRDSVIKNILIPLFDSLEWHSKKQYDYRDWKILIKLRELGHNYSEGGLKVMDLIINQMNLRRKFINGKLEDNVSLQNMIDELLNNPNILITPEGKKYIISLGRYKKDGAPTNLILKDENGLILESFDSVNKCGKFLGISIYKVNKYLDEKKFIIYKNKKCLIQKQEENN
jgi:hypothetical protein